MTRWTLPLLFGAVIGGCERTSQPLPFASEGDVTATRTITEAGGTISTPSGAAVSFPSGSLSGAQEVTLGPTEVPAAAAESGAVVSRGFEVGPAGETLQEPASAELVFDLSSAGSRAWLASVVNVRPAGVTEIGRTRVDLARGVVEAPIRELGTMAVVIPPADAVLQVAAAWTQPAEIGLELSVSGTDSVTARCGSPEERCLELTVAASQNLLSLVSAAAVVYPYANGVLRVNGLTAEGEVVLRAALRVLLGSGVTAENVEINARVSPTAETVVSETASEITFTNMLFEISGSAGSADAAHREVRTLVISKTASPATVTVTREFQIRNPAGQLETASVSLSFPVQIHQ